MLSALLGVSLSYRYGGSGNATVSGGVLIIDMYIDPSGYVKDTDAELLGWADEVRTLRVRANADTPEDAAKAHGFGVIGRMLQV